MAPGSQPSLLSLPPEITYHIFTYLTPYELLDLQATCHHLRRHALKDRLWHDFVVSSTKMRLESPLPCESYRELFIRHHLRWFLVKHKIWFSDSPHYGQLILARYDARRGCIEAHQVVTERRAAKYGTLDWDEPVHYHTFRPKVQLDLNKPVIQLNLGDSQTMKKPCGDISMEIHSPSSDRIRNTFLHTRPVASQLIHPQMQLWPPLTLPAEHDQRTRCASASMFRSSGHSPETLSQVSDNTFRIRQWLQATYFNPHIPEILTRGLGGERVSTYATLPPECYTPTPEKPWQGIWVGDYAAHGCEFLVIIQPGPEWSWPPIPRKARHALALWPETDIDLTRGVRPATQDNSADDDDDSDAGDAAAEEEAPVAPTNAARASSFLQRRRLSSHLRATTSSSSSAAAAAAAAPTSIDTAPYKGCLYAIKLTGDPNLPRGEITFIADDLGANGFIRHVTEPLFTQSNSNSSDSVSSVVDDEDATSTATTTTNKKKLHSSLLPDQKMGARAVRSVGHIADPDFQNDAYIPSQLILMSKNKIAQYWKPFRSVSFYERVDLTKLA